MRLCGRAISGPAHEGVRLAAVEHGEVRSQAPGAKAVPGGLESERFGELWKGREGGGMKSGDVQSSVVCERELDV